MSNPIDISKMKGLFTPILTPVDAEERIDEAYLANWEAQVKAQTTEKHGTTEAGCSTEMAARQETGNTVEERIADFRKRIAARKAAEGKEYLSFYYVTAQSYEIQQ